MFLIKDLTNLGMRVVQITKDQGSSILKRLNAGRFLTKSESLSTEVTFFYHTSGAAGKIRVVGLYMIAGIKPVETPRPVWTPHHAETTTDTAMIVHGNYAVIHTESSFSRTYPDTGGIVTVIAENEKVILLSRLG